MLTLNVRTDPIPPTAGGSPMYSNTQGMFNELHLHGNDFAGVLCSPSLQKG